MFPHHTAGVITMLRSSMALIKLWAPDFVYRFDRNCRRKQSRYKLSWTLEISHGPAKCRPTAPYFDTGRAGSRLGGPQHTKKVCRHFIQSSYTNNRKPLSVSVPRSQRH